MPALVVIACLAVGLFVAIILLIVRLLIRTLCRSSALPQLAQQFATGEPPPPQIQHRRSMRVGSIYFKRCVSMGVSTGGLYLHARTPLFTTTAMLIPWTQIRVVGSCRLYWRKAVTLSVGQPQIASVTLPADVIERMPQPDTAAQRSHTTLWPGNASGAA